MKTLMWAMLLIFLPLYMVALILTDSLGENAASKHGAESFDSLVMAFFTLFRCVVGGDCTTSDGSPIFVLVSEHYGWIYGAIYCVVMVLMTFGLFNVIVAI